LSSAATAALVERALAIGHMAADAARAAVLPHFRSPVPVDIKADASPVTVADRQAETVIRRVIEAAFPDHGILGEEFGADRADAEFVWVIDPIDGTKSFISGKPLFGCLIALCREGLPIVGVMDMPALGERWSGADGHPSRLDDRPLRTRACADLADAVMYATSPAMFQGADAAAYARLASRVRYALYGADCHQSGYVAAGWSDLVVEASLKPYDICALVPIVRGAGGIACGWDGAPVTIATDGRVLMAGDPGLRDSALAVLSDIAAP
jgi:inositol-phosphate phosphatase/L-galactose 1-phosphate phosphatase/histidinol-phosphatase